MTAARFRAWQFLHPDVDAPEKPGLQISASGGIGMVEEHASIRQALMLLLSTLPGERVMRPDYGCDLFRLVFAPNDDTTAGLAIHYVRWAVTRWESRVDILRVDAERSSEAPEHLEITLEYRVRATRALDGLRIGLNLEGSAP
jgi:uncharacterized protein